jgi:hypothetical protein
MWGGAVGPAVALADAVASDGRGDDIGMPDQMRVVKIAGLKKITKGKMCKFC